MNYQRLILVGNATDDAERKTSEKGDVTYTAFRVGVSDAKDRPTYFPVTVFGKFGEVVAEYVTKGRQVTVEGRITVNENGRFNVVADKVVFGLSARKTEEKPGKLQTTRS